MTHGDHSASTRIPRTAVIVAVAVALLLAVALGVWAVMSHPGGAGNSNPAGGASTSTSYDAQSGKSGGAASKGGASDEGPSMKVEQSVPDQPADDGSTVDFGTGKPVTGNGDSSEDSSDSYDFGESTPAPSSSAK